ncbi:hypothetical protein [Leptospira sp. id769339]|uniref:hypothetical protein n=1 Tax=Leptospira sp. id769339 TaxID=2864221 RepID=UPI00214BABCD|nr:hypothetical protein [Leptospira sp. id769339]MCR1795595.1 hypothetical protein [Leptospira sp. id769339]
MNYFLLIIGLIGSIASIISLFIPLKGNRTKLIHAVYIFIIVLITGISVFYCTKYYQLVDATCTAQILKEKRMNLTPNGFNLAALAFLDKNKDLFAHSYLLASKICEEAKCTQSRYTNEKIDSYHGYGQIEASSAISGLLEGIIISNNSVNCN